jgi:hypothetical protein
MKWSWSGPNLIEAVLEILIALVFTAVIVWLGEDVFGWGQIGTWEWVAVYTAIYMTARIRFNVR